MREDVLEDQQELVELIEEAGWAVTEAEVSIYESPWLEADDPEATIVITARKPYPTDDEGSPYRVK